MTKKIKHLRNAELRAHRPPPGKPNTDGTLVFLRKGSDNDLAELPKEHGKHTVYEVRLAEGFVYLVEGIDFEFV